MYKFTEEFDDYTKTNKITKDPCKLLTIYYFIITLPIYFSKSDCSKLNYIGQVN